MYSTLENVRTSLRLAWKYKILWVFALVAFMGFAGGLSENREDTKTAQAWAPTKLALTTDEILDIAPISEDTTKPTTVTHQSKLTKIWSDNIVKITIGLVVVGIASVYLRLLISSWGIASLVQTTIEIIKSDNSIKLLLRDINKKAMVKTSQMLKLRVYFFLRVLFQLIIITLLSIGVVLFGYSKVPIPAVMLFILMLISCFYIIHWYIGMNYSYRFVDSEQISSRDAFKKGIHLLNKNKLLSYKLAGANAMIFGSTLGITTILAVTNKDNLNNIFLANPGFDKLLSLVLIFIVFLFILSSISAYLTTYKNFSWSALFLELTKNEK